MTAPRLTKPQQQAIRRMREANVDCLDIAAALEVPVKGVSGFIANQKNIKAMCAARSIAKLVTVKCPEAWMRARKVDYRRTG